MITNPTLGTPLQTILENEGGIGFFQRLIPNMVGLSLVIGVIIFFFIMTIGAIQWITSGGDKAAVEAAKGKLTNAFIGIFLLLILFAILKFVGDFVGVEILTLDIGPLKIQ